MKTILKKDLVDKCIRYNYGGVCIVMKVTKVDKRRVEGINALGCERAKADMANGYMLICSFKYSFTLYLDGESVDNIEILSEHQYANMLELYEVFKIKKDALIKSLRN